MNCNNMQKMRLLHLHRSQTMKAGLYTGGLMWSWCYSLCVSLKMQQWENVVKVNMFRFHEPFKRHTYVTYLNKCTYFIYICVSIHIHKLSQQLPVYGKPLLVWRWLCECVCVCAFSCVISCVLCSCILDVSDSLQQFVALFMCVQVRFWVC